MDEAFQDKPYTTLPMTHENTRTLGGNRIILINKLYFGIYSSEQVDQREALIFFYDSRFPFPALTKFLSSVDLNSIERRRNSRTDVSIINSKAVLYL